MENIKKNEVNEIRKGERSGKRVRTANEGREEGREEMRIIAP